MLNELLSWFNEDTIERFKKIFDEVDYSNFTKGEKELFADVTSFNEVDGHYELTMKVKENADNDKIKIDLDGRTLKIVYKEKTIKSESTVMLKETLPYDADEATLEASVLDGKLVVTVEKKKKELEKRTTRRIAREHGPSFYA